MNLQVDTGLTLSLDLMPSEFVSKKLSNTGICSVGMHYYLDTHPKRKLRNENEMELNKKVSLGEREKTEEQ